MKVDFWTLNEGYQALVRLAVQPIEKKPNETEPEERQRFSIVNKLGRVSRDAKKHVDQWGQEEFPALLANEGFRHVAIPDQPGRAYLAYTDGSDENGNPKPVAEAEAERFNRSVRHLMREKICELAGEHYTPFDVNKLLKYVSIPPWDYGLLCDWLIVGELPEETEEEKTKGAAA